MVQVEEWQKIQRKAAKEEGYVCTILGRRRLLPDAKGGGKKAVQVSASPSLPAPCNIVPLANMGEPLAVIGVSARASPALSTVLKTPLAYEHLLREHLILWTAHRKGRF